MEAIEVMKEEFLCYIWENRLLKGRLATTDGVEIEIVNAGYRNSTSRLQIGTATSISRTRPTEMWCCMWFTNMIPLLPICRPLC